ncbi:SpoIIE family protein phosphatase [Candidatus Poribacteria bacterium]
MGNKEAHLLIVGCNEKYLEILSRHPGQQGYTTTIAEDGRQALDIIKTQKFDLVLLGVNIPELSGYQVLEHLKADSALRHIPVIMLANSGETDGVERYIEMGAADYLVEPLNPTLLKSRVDACLEKQRLENQLVSCSQEKEDMERLANDLMSVVFPLGTALSSESSVKRLAERIVQEAMSFCNADGGILYLHTEDDRLEPNVLHNNALGIKMGGTTGKQIPLPKLSLYDEETSKPNHSNFATHVALDVKTINIPDIYSAERFDFSSIKDFDQKNNYRSISCLAIPLKGNADEVIGVLQLLNAQDQETGEVIPFNSYLQQMASALAAQASITLNNRLLLKHQEDVLKFARELQIGRDIQKSFLPDELPEFSGWEVVARFKPARNVGGDFYDAFPLTQNRRLGFVIADVCDKGVGAALFMGLIRSLVRAFAQQHHSLSWMDTLSRGGPTAARGRSGRRQLPSVGIGALKNGVELTNNYIANNHGKSGMFATLFFGVLDPTTGALAYINGGHEPPVIFGPDGVQKEKLGTTGPAVGAFPDVEFNIQETQFEPGDTLFAYTDGVTDAEDPYGERFGRERLFSLLEQPVTCAAAMLERIETRLHVHIAYAEQFDDITMLAVRRSPASKPQ